MTGGLGCQVACEPTVCFAAMRAGGILRCIGKSVASMLREMILPLSPSEATSGPLHIWSPVLGSSVGREMRRQEVTGQGPGGGYKDVERSGVSLL